MTAGPPAGRGGLGQALPLKTGKREDSREAHASSGLAERGRSGDEGGKREPGVPRDGKRVLRGGQLRLEHASTARGWQGGRSRNEGLRRSTGGREGPQGACGEEVTMRDIAPLGCAAPKKEGITLFRRVTQKQASLQQNT